MKILLNHIFLFTLITLLCNSILPASAFEDCIITGKSKLVNIRIENNSIIDVHPLITVMNKKNTLVVHPLKEGTTCFTVSKNYKEDVLFMVKVDSDKTIISQVEGFEILSIDSPPFEEELFLDLPPMLNDIPPKLRDMEDL